MSYFLSKRFDCKEPEDCWSEYTTWNDDALYLEQEKFWSYDSDRQYPYVLFVIYVRRGE